MVILFNLRIVAVLCAGLVFAENLNEAFDILAIVPLTTVGPNHVFELSNQGFSHMIASLLAVEHFNNRNTTIVPELSRIVACGYFLRISFADSRGSGLEALAEVFRRAYNKTLPDAIVGGTDDSTALQLSAAGSSLQIPTVSYSGFDERVVTQSLYPYASRTAPGSSAMGKVILSYLFYRQRSNFVGILYAFTDVSLQIHEALMEQAKMSGISTQEAHYQPSPAALVPPQDLVDSLKALMATGYTTIIFIADDHAKELPLVAEAAQNLGMTSNNSYFWVIAGNIDLDFFVTLSSTNPQYQSVAELLTGSVAIQVLDAFTANSKDNTFLTSWKDNDQSLIRQSQTLNPLKAEHPEFLSIIDEYSTGAYPAVGSSFVFDAIMSIGLGLCEGNNTNNTDLIGVINRLSFVGASGLVEYNSSEDSGGRVGDTVDFGAFNLFPPNKSVQNGSNVVLTDVLDGRSQARQQREWRQVATFIYPDGSSSASQMLRKPSNQHYLSTVSRIWGFMLFSVAALFAILTVIWVFLHRKHRRVRASQPFFLYFVAFGAFLVAFAIIVNSFDEGRGWTVERLSNACTASPWTVVLGVLVIYSALFCKLWRVNIVMQFRRKAVTVQSVIWPAAILTAAALILMTVWTVLEGFQWVRTEVDPISGASFGKCKGEHTVAYFTPIFFLICIPVFFTAFMAYKTKDVDAAFSEGSWIFALIAVHIQFLLISIPLLRTLEQSSTNARYVGQSTIFFAFSMSTLLLIIGPKVINIHMQKGARDTIRASGAGSVRISGFQASSSYVIQSNAEIVQQQQADLSMPKIDEGDEAEVHSPRPRRKFHDGGSSTSDPDDDEEEEVDSLDDSVEEEEEGAPSIATMTTTQL